MVKTFQTWEHLLGFLEETYRIEPDLMSVLFLVGIHETGGGFRNYSRKEKTELIKTAQFVLLSKEKFYIKIAGESNELVWAENPDRPLPSEPILEKLLHSLLLDYFNEKQMSN